MPAFVNGPNGTIEAFLLAVGFGLLGVAFVVYRATFAGWCVPATSPYATVLRRAVGGLGWLLVAAALVLMNAAMFQASFWGLAFLLSHG